MYDVENVVRYHRSHLVLKEIVKMANESYKQFGFFEVDGINVDMVGVEAVIRVAGERLDARYTNPKQGGKQ